MGISYILVFVFCDEIYSKYTPQLSLNNNVNVHNRCVCVCVGGYADIQVFLGMSDVPSIFVA